MCVLEKPRKICVNDKKEKGSGRVDVPGDGFAGRMGDWIGDGDGAWPQPSAAVESRSLSLTSLSFLILFLLPIRDSSTSVLPHFSHPLFILFLPLFLILASSYSQLSL